MDNRLISDVWKAAFGVVGPQKIVCVGRNYGAHLGEEGEEPPVAPLLFAKFANGQWFRSKGYDTFCPILPGFVDRREIGDGRGLRVTQRLNGAVMQDGSTDDLSGTVGNPVATTGGGS